MTRRSAPLALHLALAALLCGGRPAVAQDDGAPDAADLEDRERIEDLVRSLNNPVVLRVEGQLRDRIERLMSSDHPLARRKLRELLLDTGTRTIVVQQIISSVIVDRHAADLVADVVERLRIEQDSALARTFDDVLLRFADTDLVQLLGALARDAARESGFRTTAVATLGRTGHAEALSVLLDLWSDEDAEVRLAASRAFVRIVPFVRSREEAQRLVAEIGERQLPLAEVLRRHVRALESEVAAAPEQDFRGPYVELARAALAHVPLDVLVGLYLRSPLPEVRAATAARLREFPWDGESDPQAARRAAGKALLHTLLREESTGVEAEILDTLVPLAPALRENVDDEELGALLVRARASGEAARPVRRAAVRMIAALRDPRPVRALEEEFDALRDTDPELRMEILAALEASGVDLTDWLARRVLEESDVRVAYDMVQKLAKAASPAAIGVFVQLLRTEHPDELVRNAAVQGLAYIWASSGELRARDALIAQGLADPAAAIREASANGLGYPRPGDRSLVVEALEGAVRRGDEDVRVRVAAARGILDLDPKGALERLGPTFAFGPVWDLYRTRRTDDLRGSHITVQDVLLDAQVLWSDGDPELRERALQLLQAVVDAGADLWESGAGRGLVRERLAERLLEAGRPADACVAAEGLVAATPREGDPRHRWRLLLARALRASGSRETLERAERELVALRADASLPAALAASVRLELGHTLLLEGDATAALGVLAAVDAAALRSEDAKRLEVLAVEARDRSEKERARVLDLVDRISDGAAQDELRALGARAAQHIDGALALAAEGAASPRLRSLLLATAVLARRTFEIPEGATPEQIADIVAQARAFLAAEIARPASGGNR